MSGADIMLADLRSALHYNEETGAFTWLVSTNGRIKVGDPAGSLNSKGYMTIGFKGKERKAHRMAWLWKYGVWPTGQIDHIDGDKSNNRIANLREVTNTENQQNRRRARRDNKSTGLIGSKLHRKTGKYMANIGVDGKRIYLGLFATPELAHEAYLQAKRKLHQNCTI